MQRITPFLWFDRNAEEAINFYISVFSAVRGESVSPEKQSKIVSLTRYGDEFPDMKGKVLTAEFKLDGQDFMAIDGGPQFKFTEAISLFVNCETQEEVDLFWEKLSEGGEEKQCGWLKDRYGISWQIIPKALGEMMQDKDLEKAKRVMRVMLQMKKIDTKILQEAYDKE